MQDYADVFQKIVIGLVVLAVAVFVVARLGGRGREDEPHDTEQIQMVMRSGKDH